MTTNLRYHSYGNELISLVYDKYTEIKTRIDPPDFTEERKQSLNRDHDVDWMTIEEEEVVFTVHPVLALQSHVKIIYENIKRKEVYPIITKK
jgi:hypothetical protein